MRYALLLFLWLPSVCVPAKSETADSFSSRVDALFAKYDTTDVPGCAVGIIQNGEYVHARGYGSANLEHGIPIDRESVFRIGSVSKQFTAAAIAILARRGDLNLDADVHTFLPELRAYDFPVSVRQMIHHISGMGEYEGKTTYEVRHGEAFRFGNEHYWTIDEFYREVATQPLALIPGERFEYSNIAYFLLSQIVERVSGRTLRRFANEEIFEPLNMRATFFNDDVNGIVTNRADGYRPLEAGGFEIYMTNLDWVGDGGVYTTLNDFIKWDRAFIGNTVPGGSSVRQLMLTPHPVTVGTMDSEPLDPGAGYGFGLDIGKFEGLTVHAHGGSWVGFRAFYARFPDDGFSVVTFCNRSDGLSGNTVRDLLELAVTEFSR